MTDDSGSAVAILLGELIISVKFLDMTAADICEIISVKKQPLPLEHVRQCLPHKLFKIQPRKAFSRTSDMRLFIVSYFVKEDLFQLPAPVASEEIGESSNTKLENVATRKELKKELESWRKQSVDYGRSYTQRRAGERVNYRSWLFYQKATN
uniref:Uncharacterized protein n=1 Tax=Nicotiana tabacum TaxID=4097 RepID=A0A1S3XET4_TOBAC|nr:PREDICTED: uncharacterized protein LOC107764334 [Nicotiana tabacum]